jgi:ABC-type nitrate/sulfonate/bicarbonate transport system substrate-binding protein
LDWKEQKMNKIFVALLTIFLAQTSAQAADKIRISTPGDAAHFTMHLAQKRGFLKEEGFEAEIITISGPVANIALSNGDTDYFSGFGSALRSILQGLPLRIVACYRPTPSFHVAEPARVQISQGSQGQDHRHHCIWQRH